MRPFLTLADICPVRDLPSASCWSLWPCGYFETYTIRFPSVTGVQWGPSRLWQTFAPWDICLHQQKYYPALCVSCASDAPDAGTLIANQDATTLPHNIQDAPDAAPNTQDAPDAAPKAQDATWRSTKYSGHYLTPDHIFLREAKGPPFTCFWPWSPGSQ